MFLMWQCVLVHKSAIVRGEYVHVHTLALYVLAPVCYCLFMRSWAGMSPPDQPLSPPVFASWSKPLPCHRSFWCSGTIEPVEVLISSSIHLHKGQASRPSPVQCEGGGKDPGRTLEVPCLQACLVRLWTSGAKAVQANCIEKHWLGTIVTVFTQSCHIPSTLFSFLSSPLLHDEVDLNVEWISQVFIFYFQIHGGSVVIWKLWHISVLQPCNLKHLQQGMKNLFKNDNSHVCMVKYEATGWKERETDSPLLSKGNKIHPTSTSTAHYEHVMPHLNFCKNDRTRLAVSSFFKSLC